MAALVLATAGPSAAYLGRGLRPRETDARAGALFHGAEVAFALAVVHLVDQDRLADARARAQSMQMQVPVPSITTGAR